MLTAASAWAPPMLPGMKRICEPAQPQPWGFTGSRRTRIRVLLITTRAPASRSSVTCSRFARITETSGPARLSARRSRMTLGQHGSVGQKLSEVSVGGNENAVIVVCPRHDVLVGLAAQAELVDVRAVVARGTQEFSHPGWQALVDQEPHALSRTGSSRSSTARAAYPRLPRLTMSGKAGASCGRARGAMLY
jgi:hypothetical protein